MTQTFIDSLFKTRVGCVKSTLGLAPKMGAIVFCETRYCYMAADGFQWLPLGQMANSTAALALAVNTPIVHNMVAGVEQQSTFYDTVVYNLNNAIYGFTPSNGNQVAINEEMIFEFTTDYALVSDIKVVTLTLKTYLNSVLVNTRILITGKVGESLPIIGFGSIPAQPGDVLTLTGETDKDCVLTTTRAKIGFRQQI